MSAPQEHLSFENLGSAQSSFRNCAASSRSKRKLRSAKAVILIPLEKQNLGIELEAAANQNNATMIGSGKCDVRVVPTDEDLEIALHARALSQSC